MDQENNEPKPDKRPLREAQTPPRKPTLLIATPSKTPGGPAGNSEKAQQPPQKPVNINKPPESPPKKEK
ncbi:MAG: hypothetical protein PVH29_02315 [Candidatus Zixiibacteriota bacterium]|jgi:hypothetical protein